jgi:hypothetical protein
MVVFVNNLYAQSIFDREKLHSIHLFLSDQNWFDTLQVFYDAGLTGADKKTLPAHIIVDGDTLPSDIGIRFKGHYSNYGFPGKKKPFRLHFGKYEEDQDYQGIKKLNLHNLAGDPSFLREFVAYDFLRSIGIAASRTSFTQLYINDVYFGCYLIVEEPEDKSFLKQNFGTDKGNLFDAAESTDLAWVDSLPASYPQLKLQSKERTGSWDKLIDWLNVFNNYYHLDFQQQLHARFQVDEYLKVLATDMLLDNWDSYASNGRNFYLYDNPETGRIYWVPWDYNLSFWNKNLPPLPKKNDDKYRPLIWRISNTPFLKEKYFRTLCHLVDYEMNTYPVAANTTAAFELIKNAVEQDTMKFYTNQDFYKNRTEDVTVNMLRDNKPKDITLPGVTSYFAKRRNMMRNTLSSLGCNCDALPEKEEIPLYVNIYPNPVDDWLNIYTENRLSTIRLTIVNTAGAILASKELPVTKGYLKCDLHTLSKGIYFLKLDAGSQQKTIRISKN